MSTAVENRSIENASNENAGNIGTDLEVRPVFSTANVHKSIRKRLGGDGPYVREVLAALETNDVVVVGMGQNPVVKRARTLLTSENVPFAYLGWGSYLSMWRDRLELKMWTGWKTFPMVFVKGTFIGGEADLKKLIGSGELKEMLATKDA